MNFSLVIRFIAVWIIKNILVASHSCKLENKFEGLEINCENKIFDKKFPRNLPSNAVTLDISNNDFCIFERGHFSQFKSLVTLIMTNLRCELKSRLNVTVLANISLEDETFDDLLLLETLDMSNSPIIATLENRFHWPKNLKLLRLINVHYVPWDLTELAKLEIFVGANCNKHSWPAFHPMAPLYFIDLRENNISHVRVEHVANFCLLTALLIDTMWHDDRVFPIKTNPAPYDDFSCTCLRLRAWVQLKDIYGLEYMECSFTSEDNITRSATLEKPCNGSFDIAEKIYDSCWARNLEELMYFYLYISVSILATVVIVGGLLLLLKKTCGVYEGSRNEVIEDPNARDSSSIYDEFESENEEIGLASITIPVRLGEPFVYSTAKPSTTRMTKSTKLRQTSSRSTVKR